MTHTNKITKKGKWERQRGWHREWEREKREGQREREITERGYREIDRKLKYKLVLCMYNSAQQSYNLVFGFGIWVWPVQHLSALHLHHKNERGGRNMENENSKWLEQNKRRKMMRWRNRRTRNSYNRRADVENCILCGEQKRIENKNLNVHCLHAKGKLSAFFCMCRNRPPEKALNKNRSSLLRWKEAITILLTIVISLCVIKAVNEW